jgi:glycine hydroxymethyltransferase
VEQYYAKKNMLKKIDKAIFPGIQGGPLMHVIASKAVSFGEALKPEFKEYQKQVISNAKALADALKENGFRLVTDGTDNHLVLIDVRTKGLTGKKAESLLEEVRVTTNKNTIPFDPESPFVTSGVRIGTPAVTTRGMKEEDMKEIAYIITMALDETKDREEIKKRVKTLCDKFPLY